MLDLNQPHGAVPVSDIHCYVNALEEWLIRALDRFNVKGERRRGRVGIWSSTGGRRRRSAPSACGSAGGVLARRRAERRSGPVAFLRHRTLRRADHGVTSLATLGIPATMQDADVALRAAWDEVFGDSAASVCAV